MSEKISDIDPWETVWRVLGLISLFDKILWKLLPALGFILLFFIFFLPVLTKHPSVG